MIEVLTTNHYDAIQDLFENATKSVKIVSPFLSLGTAKKLCNFVTAKGMGCTFITRLYIQDLLDKANSLEALWLMKKAGIKVYAVKGLHTKLYLFDSTSAVMGSANFTSSGLKTNIELSLHFEDEPEITKELDGYFEKLQLQVEEGGGGITDEMLQDAQAIYDKAWKSSKSATMKTKSYRMYGAVIEKGKNYDDTKVPEKEFVQCQGETDIVHDSFVDSEIREEKKFGYAIWLKFDGEASDRIAGDEPYPMVDVEWGGKTVWIENYPWRPARIKDGDMVYLAAITTDKHGKHQPVIMGRGYMRDFQPENHFRDEWRKKYSWMDRYPWFCVIDKCEVLDTGSANGIPLDKVLQALGSDTYVSSFGKNEPVSAVTSKHYQKAHLQLSGNAKEYIDKLFEELKEKYGVVIYASE